MSQSTLRRRSLLFCVVGAAFTPAVSALAQPARLGSAAVTDTDPGATGDRGGRGRGPLRTRATGLSDFDRTSPLRDRARFGRGPVALRPRMSDTTDPTKEGAPNDSHGGLADRVPYPPPSGRR